MKTKKAANFLFNIILEDCKDIIAFEKDTSDEIDTDESSPMPDRTAVEFNVLSMNDFNKSSPSLKLENVESNRFLSQEEIVIMKPSLLPKRRGCGFNLNELGKFL